MKKLYLILIAGLALNSSAYAVVSGGSGCECESVTTEVPDEATAETCAAAVEEAIAKAGTLECVDINVEENGGYTHGDCQQFENSPEVQDAITRGRGELPQDCNSSPRPIAQQIVA